MQDFYFICKKVLSFHVFNNFAFIVIFKKPFWGNIMPVFKRINNLNWILSFYWNFNSVFFSKLFTEKKPVKKVTKKKRLLPISRPSEKFLKPSWETLLENFRLFWCGLPIYVALWPYGHNQSFSVLDWFSSAELQIFTRNYSNYFFKIFPKLDLRN